MATTNAIKLDLGMRSVLRIALLMSLLWTVSVSGFVPSYQKTNEAVRQQPPSSFSCRRRLEKRQHEASLIWPRPSSLDDNNEVSECWNPKLRRTLASIASLGVLETAYLTFNKIAGLDAICGTSDCGSVLNGPYAVLPGTSFPLSALGFLAYSSVLALALGPIVSSNEDDEQNRVWLTALTTAMGTFSVFLMTMLFGVLHQSCPYCVASATFSILLAKISWLGGVLPKERGREGIVTSFNAGLASFVGAAVIFFANDPSPAVNPAGTLVAQAGNAPPPISTVSSARALDIANQLEALDAHFYGAFWCSHCYDQKETLGREAMAKIPYIECSKDGLNAQTDLCKEKKVPGYPTWEINGRLYPGEQALDELEDIIRENKK